MDGDLRSKVAVITGASRGVGRALCGLLVDRGYRVAGWARDEARLVAVGSGIDPSGGRFIPVPCDISKEGEVQAAADRVIGEWGRVDIVVHCAGAGYWGEIEDCRVEDWERSFDTNVKGAFLTVRALLPAMKAQASGRVVFVSSLAQRCEGALEAPFGASKRALQGLARTLGLELREYGIAVTLLAPGALNTRGFVEDAEKEQPWYGVPALELATVIGEVLERGRNVWVREIEVEHLGGGAAGPDGLSLEKRPSATEGEPRIRVRPPVLASAAGWSLERAREIASQGRPGFELEVGEGELPASALYESVRVARNHGLGRAFFVGRAPAAWPGLLDLLYYAKHQGIRSFGMRTGGAGLDEPFLLETLAREGLDIWELVAGPDELSGLPSVVARLGALPGAIVTAHLSLPALGDGDAEAVLSAAHALREACPALSGVVVEPHEEVLRRGGEGLRELARACAEARERDGIPVWVDGWRACLDPALPDSHTAFVEDGCFRELTKSVVACPDAGGSERSEVCARCRLAASCVGHPVGAQTGESAGRYGAAGELLGGVEAGRGEPSGARRVSAGESGALARLDAALRDLLPRGLTLEAPGGQVDEGGGLVAYKAELVARSYRVGFTMTRRHAGGQGFLETESFRFSHHGAAVGEKEGRLLAIFAEAVRRGEAELVPLFDAAEAR